MSSPLNRLSVVVVSVLAAGALAGCTGTSLAGGCTAGYEPGDASSTVTASGDVGESPAIEFPTPLIANEPQRSVLVDGTGEPASPGAVVRVSYVLFDGATGQAGQESVALITADEDQLALGEALQCAQAGSRIALVGPIAQVHPDAGDGAEGTVVVVYDVLDVFLGKANGVNQLPDDGMPTVVTAVDGEPGLGLSYETPPREPRISTIKAGGGATVEEGDTVVFHARSWTWPQGTGNTPSVGQIDSWTRGTPFALAPTDQSMGDATLVEALIGARVGSQILVVIPDGAADGEDPTTVGGGATVYVFDILGLIASQ